MAAFFDQKGRISVPLFFALRRDTDAAESLRPSVRRDADAAETLRPSVRRDADAAETLRPSVRRDTDASESMRLSRTSATRMLPKNECMRSRVASCKLRFDAAEPRALDGPSVRRRRAPSPLIRSPIYGIIYGFIAISGPNSGPYLKVLGPH